MCPRSCLPRSGRGEVLSPERHGKKGEGWGPERREEKSRVPPPLASSGRGTSGNCGEQRKETTGISGYGVTIETGRDEEWRTANLC